MQSYSLWRYTEGDSEPTEDPVSVILGEENEAEFLPQSQFDVNSSSRDTKYLIDEDDPGNYEQQRLNTGVIPSEADSKLNEFDRFGYNPASD